MPFEITELSSPTHYIKSKKAQTKATVKYSNSKTSEAFDSDFILMIGVANPHQPRMWIEKNEKNHSASMYFSYPTYVTCRLCFYPGLFDITLPANYKKEIIILIDRSHSMYTSFPSVQLVVQELLGALNSRNTFNIISFGSSMQSLFVQSKPGDSLEKKSELGVKIIYSFVGQARLSVEEMSSNYGSSELWKSLRSILQLQTLRNQELANREISPSLILISDGQVTEPEYSLEMISQLRKVGVTTFPLGIGKSMNRYFLKQGKNCTH